MARRPITFLLPTLEPGGGERKTVVLANGFAARGHEVDLCTAFGADGLLRADVDPKVRVVPLEIGRSRYFFLPIRRYLRRERPRLLICVMHHAAVFGTLANLGSFTRTPIVVIEGGMNLTVHKSNDRLRYRMLQAQIRMLYGMAKRVFVNAEPIKRELIEHAGLAADHIEVISNPSAVPVFADVADEPPPEDWPAGDAPALISVGRMDDNKDIATLVRAFALVRARRPLRLVVVGDGPERERLEALAGELGVGGAVHFLGTRTKPWRYVRQARVFAMASRTEGFSNALIEAMAVGCPVVATDCAGGTGFILDGGRLGPLVPVGDPAPMAAAIERMLDDPTDPAQLIARAREFSQQRIDAYLGAIERFID